MIKIAAIFYKMLIQRRKKPFKEAWDWANGNKTYFLESNYQNQFVATYFLSNHQKLHMWNKKNRLKLETLKNTVQEKTLNLIIYAITYPAWMYPRQNGQLQT